MKEFMDNTAYGIANAISGSDEWNLELCAELCEMADMLDEWNAAGGETFESVIYDAARKLGVQIW